VEEADKKAKDLMPPVKMPKVPEPPKIRDNIKQIMDNMLPSLTRDELLYLTKKLRETALASLKTQQASQPPNVVEQSQPTKEPVPDLFRQMTEGLEELEEVVTYGYPKFNVVPPNTQEKSGFGDDLLQWIGDRLDKMLENPKVGDELARLLGALADKLEGK